MAVVVGGLATGRPALGVAAAGLLLVAVGVGGLRLAEIDAVASGLHDGQRLSGPAVIDTRPRPSRFGSSLELELPGHVGRPARLLGRLPPWLSLPAGARPGAIVSVSGEFRQPHRRTGSAFDFPAYLRRRGLAGELELESVRASGRFRGGARGLLDRMRARAEAAVSAGLSPDEAALLRGMVLGEDESISAPVRQDWRRSGLAHLLAVSGQNVMLLMALVLPALSAARLGRAARTAVLVLLVGLYVPLAGAGPSLQRAGVMGVAAIAAAAASRPASRWYALLLAAAITLAVNPRATADPGWQLSFAAVTGILLLASRIRRRTLAGLDALASPRSPRRPAPRWLESARGLVAEGAALTVAATLATIPLLGHDFGSVPLASLPANLLALPAVAPVMWLGMIKAGLGQFAALGSPLAQPAAALTLVLGGLASAPLRYLELLAERFASLPGATLQLPLHSWSATVVGYALVASGLLALRLAGRRVGGPQASALAARWRRLPRRSRIPGLAVVCALSALALARLLAPAAAPTRLTVRFLDVGQGDATLIQDSDGTAVLFDGGPPGDGISRLLRRAGVRRLAVVVATHKSLDHHGGLRDVLASYPVGLLLDGGDGTRDPTFRAVEALADRRGVRRIAAVAPLDLRVGRLRIRVISPPPRPPGPPPEDPNPRAVVAIVGEGGFDLFLSADAESDALAPLDLPDVDAIKVPHHGSADPGLPRLLARLRPEAAVIEVGAHNPYGHPAPSTLHALRRARVPTWRTDRDGTVTLTPGAHGLQVSTEH
jgi:competence protein ComEC